MTEYPTSITIIGASGGIGRALCLEALERYPGAALHALCRSGDPGLDHDRLTAGRLDYDDPASIEAAAEGVKQAGAPDLVLVATGLLHTHAFGPEKSLRDLDADRLTRVFHINAIGPALVMKHFLPIMPRENRSVFAAISARVGSISDNRIGGWYGYRSAKAALNQMIRTASIEHGRKYKQAIVMGLHPGTVDTALSQPFQGNVPEGKLFTPAFSASTMLDVIEARSVADSGKVFAWDGAEVPA